MIKRLFQTSALVALSFSLCLAADVTVAVHGTVTKVDAAAKTMVVKTKEGMEHTVHFVDATVVHGSEAGAKDAFKGVKEGAEVVVHYTEKGADWTAVEVDRVGKGGMKSTEVAASDVSKDGKSIAVKAKDGTVETFKVADHATEEAGKDVAKGSEKAAKITVYYTEEGGKKIVHVFERKK